MQTRFSGTFGHRYRRAHIHARVDCRVGGQSAESVAANVAEHSLAGIGRQHAVQFLVQVAVAAAHAECGRAVHHNVGNRLTHNGFHAKRRCHGVGREFAHSRQSAVKAATEFLVVRESAKQFLVNRITFLNYQNIIVFIDKRLHHIFGQRILRNLENRQLKVVGLADFHHVVVANAEGDNGLLALALDNLVERRRGRRFLDCRLLVNQPCVVLFGDCRQQNPLTRVHIGVEGVLVAHRFALNNGARVRHTCCKAQNNRQFHCFRQVQTKADGVVGFLLGCGLKQRQHRKASVGARVLLVLRRVHRRVVGNHQNQAAVDARNGRVHKRVGADVQAHVLHTHNAALARKRHSECGFVGRLLVGRPFRADFAALRVLRFLNEFCYFCRRRARIGVNARNARIDCTHGNRFGT